MQDIVMWSSTWSVVFSFAMSFTKQNEPYCLTYYYLSVEVQESAGNARPPMNHLCVNFHGVIKHAEQWDIFFCGDTPLTKEILVILDSTASAVFPKMPSKSTLFSTFYWIYFHSWNFSMFQIATPNNVTMCRKMVVNIHYCFISWFACNDTFKFVITNNEKKKSSVSKLKLNAIQNEQRYKHLF